MDEKIVPIPVKFKHPVEEGKFLKIASFSGCFHGPFLIDEKLNEVTCEKCSEKLNPMHVLTRLAREETKWHMAHQKYDEEMKRLGDRSRTKCEFCQKMTRISRS